MSRIGTHASQLMVLESSLRAGMVMRVRTWSPILAMPPTRGVTLQKLGIRGRDLREAGLREDWGFGRRNGGAC